MDRKKQRDALPRDDYYMGLAHVVSAMCRNPTPSGSVVLHASGHDYVTGVDVMPGVSDAVPWDTDLCVHSETEALISASSPEGSTLYSTRCPCASCTSLAVRLGIKRIVYHTVKPCDKVLDIVRLAYIQLEEFKVDIIRLRDFTRGMEQ